MTGLSKTTLPWFTWLVRSKEMITLELLLLVTYFSYVRQQFAVLLSSRPNSTKKHLFILRTGVISHVVEMLSCAKHWSGVNLKSIFLDSSTKKQGVSLNSLSLIPCILSPCLLLRMVLPLDLLQCILRRSQGEKTWGISTQAPPLTPSHATFYNALVQMWKDKVSLSQGCRAQVLESHKPAF